MIAIDHSADVSAMLNVLFQHRYRSMRWDTFQIMCAWRDLMMDTISLKLDPHWIPIPELDHIETRHFPDRLDSVRDGWDITRLLPILLYQGRDGIQLWNGNHRLTNARAMECDAIRAVVVPFDLDYTQAIEREIAIFDEMRKGDEWT